MSQALTSPSSLRTALTGAALASLVILGWLSLHIGMVHFAPLSMPVLIIAPLIILIQSWLAVGLFIIAHDCIHGSFAPGQAKLNRAIGWLTMTFYAGFDYDRMAEAHHRHHAAPGTAQDPDFSAAHPTEFWPWFGGFMKEYMSWRPVIFLNTVVAIEWLLLGASMTNLVLFYGIPSMLSALQLFYFGTYRPHRHQGDQFVDHHRTRSSGYGPFKSLMTCYHFGYHHEHHLFPHEPWWRLPARRLKTGAALAKEAQ